MAQKCDSCGTDVVVNWASKGVLCDACLSDSLSTEPVRRIAPFRQRATSPLSTIGSVLVFVGWLGVAISAIGTIVLLDEAGSLAFALGISAFFNALVMTGVGYLMKSVAQIEGRLSENR